MSPKRSAGQFPGANPFRPERPFTNTDLEGVTEQSEELGEAMRVVLGAGDELPKAPDVSSALPDKIDATPEYSPRDRERVEQMREARETIGAENFFGLEAVEKTFGFEVELGDIPPIPFSKAELERAKELGQFLILRIDKDENGDALTMERMNEILAPKFEEEDKGKVLHGTDWYKNEDFYKKEAPKLRWALVSREVIPNSTKKNYLQQTEELVNYLKTEVFKGQPIPVEYQEAITEFEGQKNAIGQIIMFGWEKAAEQLEKLKLTQLVRHSPAEAIYDLMVAFDNSEERLLSGAYTWTNARNSGGRFVNVGDFESGVIVSNDTPISARGYLGVSFSR